jgi:hypothetical protein
MTQNKFWLVRKLNIERKYQTKEQAEHSAKELAKEDASSFGVFELLKTFEGEITKTVNVIETSFEVNDDLLQDKYKFKLGDKVRILDYRGEFEISAIRKDKYNLTVYDVKALTKENVDRYNLSETMMVHI